MWVNVRACGCSWVWWVIFVGTCAGVVVAGGVGGKVAAVLFRFMYFRIWVHDIVGDGDRVVSGDVDVAGSGWIACVGVDDIGVGMGCVLGCVMVACGLGMGCLLVTLGTS